MDEPRKHEFKINFSFQNKPYTALLTMDQKEDHDEYRVIPDDEALAKEYGSQTINNYFNQKDPLRCQHNSNEYTKSIIAGIQEFLDSKHS
jgi:hypothetical protein